MSKATVIGVGSLGSCIAYEIANRGLVEELVLIDIYRELAEGNAADISQALSFHSDIDVRAGDYEDAKGSQVIVVTAGRPRTPDMKSRMELLEVNRKVISGVGSDIRKIGEEAVIVTLTNPVDVMNYVMWKATGLDRRMVLGSAGMLDSARFRTALSRRYRVPVLEVDAYVMGEHGDSQVLVFSQVRIGGKQRVFSKEERTEIAKEVRQSALNVISKKGATIFAPANNTANMTEMILRDTGETAVSSMVLDGEYGLRDVSIGVPVKLGQKGVEKVLEWELEEDEKRTLCKGAEGLKATIREVYSS